MPGFESSAALVKAAAVNSLYGANVWAIMSPLAASKICLMERTSGPRDPNLVEEMASIQLSEGKVRHCPSFASKFAHFFIDYDRFPIYDSYALKMLRDHLGHDALASKPTYMAFEKAFRKLAREVDLGLKHLSTRPLSVDRRGSTGNGSRTLNRSTGELRQQVFRTDSQPPELKDAAGEEWYRPA